MTDILEEPNNVIPEIRNAKWNNPEHTSFDVELNHPEFGWIPYGVADGDCYKISDIKDMLTIQEYTPPEIDITQEYLEEIETLKQLLANSDYKAIKYAEGQISEEDYVPIRLQRQSYRDRINELEALL